MPVSSSRSLLACALQLKDLVAELFPSKDYDAQAEAAAAAARALAGDDGTCAAHPQQQHGGANKRKMGLGDDDEEAAEHSGRKSPSPPRAAPEPAAPAAPGAASPALADEGVHSPSAGPAAALVLFSCPCRRPSVATPWACTQMCVLVREGRKDGNW